MWGLFLVIFCLIYGTVLSLSLLSLWWYLALSYRNLSLVEWLAGVILHLCSAVVCYTIYWFFVERNQ